MDNNNTPKRPSSIAPDTRSNSDATSSEEPFEFSNIMDLDVDDTGCAHCGSTDHVYNKLGDCPHQNARNERVLLNAKSCYYCGKKDCSFVDMSSCSLFRNHSEEIKRKKNLAAPCSFCSANDHGIIKCPKRNKIMKNSKFSQKTRPDLKSTFDYDPVSLAFLSRPKTNKPPPVLSMDSFKMPPPRPVLVNLPQLAVAAPTAQATTGSVAPALSSPVPAPVGKSPPPKAGPKKADPSRPAKNASLIGAAIADLNSQAAGMKDAVKEMKRDGDGELPRAPKPTPVEKAAADLRDYLAIRDGSARILEQHDRPKVVGVTASYANRMYRYSTLTPLNSFQSQYYPLVFRAGATIAGTASAALLGIGAAMVPLNALAYCLGGPIAVADISYDMASFARPAFVALILGIAAGVACTVPKPVLAHERWFRILPGVAPAPRRDNRADMSSLSELRHADPLVMQVQTTTVQHFLTNTDGGINHLWNMAKDLFFFTRRILIGTPQPSAFCTCADIGRDCHCCLSEAVRPHTVDNVTTDFSCELLAQILAGRKQDPMANHVQMYSEFIALIGRNHTTNVDRYDNVHSRLIVNTAYLAVGIAQHNKRQMRFMAMPHFDDPPSN